MQRALILIAAISLLNFICLMVAMNETDERIERLEELVGSQSVKVTATMYNPVESQCDRDPLVTAGMYRINPRKASQHKWIAVSRNLLKRWGGQFDYGDKVKVKGAGHKDGIYTIVDTMNQRYEDRIDFLETKGTKGYKFENVEIASL